MGNQQNVIVINGKKYDAKTGRLLTPAAAKAPAVKQPAKQAPVLDGVTRRRQNTPVQQVHKKTQKSQTLMRSVVKKPTVIKPVAATKRPTTKPAPAKTTAIATRKTAVNPERVSRAQAIPKSNLISKFGTLSGNMAQPKQVESRVTAAKPAPQTEPPLKVEAPQKFDFQSIIDKATSHEQPFIKLPNRRQRLANFLHLSPKAVTAGSITLSIVIFGGFMIYQNIPNLAMRVAATRSGVQARLPGYRPAGFAMSGPIQYSPGQITIGFHSKTDDRSFQVTQRSSQWNSESLRENFVAAERRQYQTYQDKGKTIYIYDDSNATWVDGGIWYQIEGDSALTSDQLIRLANSL